MKIRPCAEKANARQCFIWRIYPSLAWLVRTGELLVTGANNATLRLIAIDDVNIQIEADYNGDGIIDEIMNTTWGELED